MQNKFLNVIGIIAVAIAVTWAILTCSKKEENMLGNFNIHALENAQQRVADVLQNARASIEQLVSIEDKTYMNFVRPLMDIDQKIEDVVSPITHLDNVNNSDQTQKIMNDILPLISDFSSDMSHHKGVYQGYIDIKNNDYASLDTAQKKVVDDAIKGFEISGISLPADQQARLKEISAELSKLGNSYGNNVIEANKKNKIKITDESILGDMPDTDKQSARVDGGWEFSLMGPSYGPFMEYVTDRKLREQMYKNFVTRAPENEQVIPQILKLRDEKAKILGYKNYAELSFEFKDAPSPSAAEEYLWRIAEAAKPAAQKELKELQDFAGIDLQPWDIAYYSRLLQKQKHSLDEAEVKPYFEMNRTVDAAMGIIAQMFDIEFKSRQIQAWDNNVRYYDVYRDGDVIAGLYLDLQTRESKKPGAWMNGDYNHYLDANNTEHLPEVYVVANFQAATADTPSLLSIDNLTTLFHEMGHAVHSLLSQVNEAAISGVNVDWDVVEFPSQFLEAFWKNPTVLKTMGKHYKTGAEIPDDLIQRIIAADNFQKGMFLVRQLEFGLFDLELHQLNGADAETVQKVLDSVRERVAVIPFVPYNKFQYTFNHIFDGGYSAGYYSYMWADSLAADAYIALDGNPFNTEMTYKYRDTILANGGIKTMGELYREFLGRDPNPDSLLKIYGLK